MIWNAFLIALREIRRNLTRAFLTVLGIIIGVAAVITMVTLGQGTTQAVKNQISNLGTNLMTLHIGMGHNVEMSLTGELISGRRAYEIGLVHQVVEENTPEAVLAAAMVRAQALAALPAVPVRVSKQRMRALTQPDFDEACVAGIRYQLECYSHGTPQAAIAAFFKERAAKPAAA